MSGIENGYYSESSFEHGGACNGSACNGAACNGAACNGGACNGGACRYYGYERNLNSSDPASQYQNLKIIQNTVRVPSSLYSMNLAALNVYQKPFPLYNVNWNQMSDRKERHFQPNIVTGGSFYHGSSTKNTITRCRPGAGCPGGLGVDIKHNSYDRYLNRIKGKGPVRRGPIPPDFGSPLENLDPAIKGGKTMKTSIVSGCNCPITPSLNPVPEESLYVTSRPPISLACPNFNIGQKVYAILLDKHLLCNNENYYAEAVITAINYLVYTVQFLDGKIGYRTSCQLINYFPCNCKTNSSYDLSEDTNNFVEQDGIIIPCNLDNSFINSVNYINVVNQYTGKNLIG